jgi:hypothetical protein
MSDDFIRVTVNPGLPDARGGRRDQRISIDDSVVVIQNPLKLLLKDAYSETA